MNEEYLLKLRELMAAEFSEADLQALCQSLELNYDELPGLGVFGKTRAVIEAARQRNLLPSLAARVRELRPAAFAAAGIAAAAEAAGSSRPRPAAATGGGAANRIGLIAGGIAVLLVAVIVLTFLLPRPAGGPAEATPDAAAASATQTPIVVAITTTSPVSAGAALTPAADPGAAATVTPEAPAEPTVTPSPTPRPTPTLSETHPAAQVIVVLNDQLAEVYRGKAKVDTLQQYAQDPALAEMRDFALKSLPRKIGVDLTKNQTATVEMRYVRPPALVALGPSGATVVSREYWSYANTRGQRSCETRDYTYLVVKTGDLYRVKEVSGELVNTNCLR
jgi:hypothetical protein